MVAIVILAYEDVFLIWQKAAATTKQKDRTKETQGCREEKSAKRDRKERERGIERMFVRAINFLYIQISNGLVCNVH